MESHAALQVMAASTKASGNPAWSVGRSALLGGMFPLLAWRLLSATLLSICLGDRHFLERRSASDAFRRFSR
jgi:hypothetical protein